MTRNLYVIYNILEESSSPPMVCSSHTHAKRMFEMSMNELPKHMNPKEFSLYAIGRMQQEFPWRIDYHEPLAIVAGSLEREEDTDE